MIVAIFNKEKNLLHYLNSSHRELYGFDDPYLVKRVSQCLMLVIPFLKQKKSITVADFGCGDLRASNLIYAQLVKHFYVESFYCIDIAPTTTHAKPEFKILQHDLNQRGLKLPDNSVDFAYALEVIEHLWNVDIFISEVYRILRSEGVFFVTTPNLVA